MFACLKVTRHTPQGIMGRFSAALKKSKTELYSAKALGREFLVVVANEGPKGIDWREICDLLSPFTRRLLTPQDHPPPEGCGLVGADFPDFEWQVLLHTACSVVDRTGIPLPRRILGLYDPAGLAADALPTLLRHYASARVVTQQLNRYRAKAAQVMEEMGAPVMLGNDPTDFADCLLLLCPVPPKESLPLPPYCPVLATRDFPGRKRSKVFTAPRVLLPAAEVQHIPPGIDAHDFAGALYEHYGVLPPRLSADKLLINGRNALPDEASAALLRQAGYPVYH